MRTLAPADILLNPGTTLKRLQLEYYVTQFPTVEINATFYRSPSEAMVRGWGDRVKEDFVYAVNATVSSRT